MARWLVILITLFFWGAKTQATNLTGRWGNERLPSQLVYKSKTYAPKALAVVTFSTVCPLAKRLVPHLNELRQKYDAKGIQLVALFPNGTDNLSEMAEFALDSDLKLPVYKDDPSDPWFEELGLKTTPEAILFDVSEGYDSRKVIYQGQVTNQWFGGGNAKGKKYLEDAIEGLIAGKEIETKATAASGCVIAKEERLDLKGFEGITYYRHILPILQERCLQCHRDGEAGAELFVAFDSYDTVSSFSETILSRIKNRIMPPWNAREGNPKKPLGFVNDTRMTEDEIKTFIAWNEQGLKAGDPKDAPPEKKWAKEGEWKIGTPDLVFRMDTPYVVPKERLDEYQYYRLKANFPEDRYLQAVEVRPGNKRVVHHIGALLGPASEEVGTGTQAMMKFYGLTGDKVKKVGDYVPGDSFNAHTYPKDYALKLPKNTDILFEMHYTPTGSSEESDVSEMGIIWAKEKPKHTIETHVFNRKDIRLRPNDSHYEMTNYYAFSSDVLIYALAPHMHYRGKSFKLYKVRNPKTKNETRELLLKVPAYDFSWQWTYEFKNPIRLRAGDALYGVAAFDNSHFNPNNPDPDVLVSYGIKSDQEMFNMRVKFERTRFKDDEK